VKAVVALVLALASTSAMADSVPNRARDLAERGRMAHDKKDYTTAIASFTEAYALAPAPGLLFNLAQAYRLRGNCDDAALMYRRFLATNPPDDARMLAESHLSTVERCLAAKIAPPVETKPRTMPGSITLAKHSEVHPALRSKETDKPGRRVGENVGLGLAIGGGAALLVAGYYGLESHKVENEVERRYANGEKWKMLEDRAAEGDRASHIAKVSLGVGAAAIAAGAAVLVIDHRRHHKSLRVEPSVSQRGASVGVSWGF
jgi:tetratricopeptide (TPR) repeat protein